MWPSRSPYWPAAAAPPPRQPRTTSAPGARPLRHRNRRWLRVPVLHLLQHRGRHRGPARVSLANISSASWLRQCVVFSRSALQVLSWLVERAPLPPATPGHPPPSRTLWAPDISFHEPTAEWRLYYAASSFGSQQSCIGLAVSPSLLEPKWTDRGPAVCSEICAPLGTASPHACNAIDPHVIYQPESGHADGRMFMTFGSFWTGVSSYTEMSRFPTDFLLMVMIC